MNLFDPATSISTSSKNANWDILFRLFTKFDMHHTITKEICDDVSSMKVHKAVELLIMLHGLLVPKKTKSAALISQIGIIEETSKLLPPLPIIIHSMAPPDPGNLVLPPMNTPKRQFYSSPSIHSDIDGSQGLEKVRIGFNGVEGIMNCLLSVFGVKEVEKLNAEWIHLAVCFRLKLAMTLTNCETMNTETISVLLKSKESEFKYSFSQCGSTTDLLRLLDILLPCLQNYAQSHIVFRGVTEILIYLSHLFHFYVGENVKVMSLFTTCAEFPALMYSLGPNTMDKTPSILMTLMFYAGNQMSMDERITFLLVLKTHMRANTPELHPFIHILSALTLLHSSFFLVPLPSENMFAFLMSEGVNVMKSRSSFIDQASALHVFTFLVSHKGPSHSILSSIPSLKNDEYCVSHAILLNALVANEKKGKGISTALVSALSDSFKWFRTDALLLLICGVIPCLRKTPGLCTAFVRGLISLEKEQRLDLLSCKSITINLNLPFETKIQVTMDDSQLWSLGIAAGICNMVAPSFECLELSFLEILSRIPINSHQGSFEEWSQVFNLLEMPLILALTQAESIHDAWTIILKFESVLSMSIIKRSPNQLLSALVYTQASQKITTASTLLEYLNRSLLLDNPVTETYNHYFKEMK